MYRVKKTYSSEQGGRVRPHLWHNRPTDTNHPPDLQPAGGTGEAPGGGAGLPGHSSTGPVNIIVIMFMDY